MTILVTGGAGYIGSHTVLELLQAGYDVVVADNLCNAKEESLRRVQELTGKTVRFYRTDLCDKAALEALSVEHWERKPNIHGYRMKDGRILNLLAEGRLVNLAAGDGHPAEIMDMSFAIQLQSVLYLNKVGKTLPNKLIQVPDEIDDQVARIKLDSMGVAVDVLTDAQKEYVNAWNAE